VQTKHKVVAANGSDPIQVELSRIARILAMSVVRELKREEQVIFLQSAGYAPAEIAGMLSIPSNTVSVILYQQKKKQRRRRIRP
jgi:DNA-directed RNA polymerase specialized sigma24 family protein